LLYTIGDERGESTAAELEMHQQHGGSTPVIVVPGTAQRFPRSDYALLQPISAARVICAGKEAGDAVRRIHRRIFSLVGAAFPVARYPSAAKFLHL